MSPNTSGKMAPISMLFQSVMFLAFCPVPIFVLMSSQVIHTAYGEGVV
jgi:hypothetical protein